MQTTIDFLRHGAVEGGSYYRGSTDDLLTKQGWDQMNNAVANKHWDLIICSPLQRCLRFAQSISKQTKTMLYIEPNWKEIDFGDWEGKTAAQIDPDKLRKFYQNPIKNTPEKGESFLAFQLRIKQAWNTAINTHQHKHILVITHAGVIRCLFTLWLNLPANKIFNLQVDHGGLTQFQCFHDAMEGNFITLVFHNK